MLNGIVGGLIVSNRRGRNAPVIVAAGKAKRSRALVCLVALAGLVAGLLPTAAAAPVNDNFADRILIEGDSQTVLGSNVEASKEPGEPSHAGTAGGHSVWWTWTAPTNGSLGLALSGTIPTKLLAVYSGVSVTQLTPINSRRSAAATNQLVVVVRAGVQYHISVDGLNDQVGDIVLELMFSSGSANDQFADRILLTGSQVALIASNFGATSEPGEPNHGGFPASASVWWSWKAPASGNVTLGVLGDIVGTDGAPFNKLIGVYQGTGVDSLSSVSQSSGLQVSAEVTFSALVGTTYQIAVDGQGGAKGRLILSLAFVADPPNDDFADRFALVGSSVQTIASNVGATKEQDEPTHAEVGARSVWWTWTAPADGETVISTKGSTFNTLLAVYSGSSLSELVPIVSNNDFEGVTSQVTFEAVAGTAYQIAVDGLVQAAGTISLNVSQANVVAPPPDLIDPQFNGTFQFSFDGPIGARYLIEATTNLIDWTALISVTNTTGTVVFVDPDSGNFTYRFYRVQVQ